MEDHPLFRLQPLPDQPRANGHAVLVSINDDRRVSDIGGKIWIGLPAARLPMLSSATARFSGE